MSEILFRGKRKDNGEWVYGNLIKTLDDKYYIISTNTEFLKNLESFTYKFIEVIPKTVGQYTEFDDKNDKKIFGNDIIKYENDIFIVFFANGCFCVQNVKVIHKIYRLYSFSYRNIEIIGNIYENPELLEEK